MAARWLGLCALVLALLNVALAADTTDIVVVVGAVTKHEARVLIYAPKGGNVTGELEVAVEGIDGTYVSRTAMVEPGARPVVLSFGGLQAATQHTGTVMGGKRPLADLSFTTMPGSEFRGSHSMVVVSCDRSFEDHDSTMWELMQERGHVGMHMLHLGDQIYADAVYRNACTDEGRTWANGSISFEGLVEAFRGVYAATFGTPQAQGVLRHGGHWMLPDDHDLVNNMGGPGSLPVVDPKGKTCRSAVLRAGRAASYEFQQHLIEDLDESCFKQDGCGDRLFRHFTVGPTAVSLLDIRIYPTFHKTKGLLDATQQQELSKWLASAQGNPGVRDIVVAMAVPLVYHSPLMAWVAEAVDGDRVTQHPDFRGSASQLAGLLASSTKPLMVAAGDVHHFSETTACKGTQCLRQCVSSGLTQGSTTVRDYGLFFYFGFMFRMTGFTVDGWTVTHRRLYPDRNYALVTSTPDGLECTPVTEVVAGWQRQVQHVGFFWWPHVGDLLLAWLAYRIIKWVLRR